MEYGVFGDLIRIYPKLYSIHLRGTKHVCKDAKLDSKERKRLDPKSASGPMNKKCAPGYLGFRVVGLGFKVAGCSNNLPRLKTVLVPILLTQFRV